MFISSTVKDLSEYRKTLSEALQESYENLRCKLSEDWPNDFTQVSQRVRSVLADNEGYYGIFAHYHGWTPPDQPHSITRMEFEWALEMWGADVPPFMAVFIPEVGSKADKQLLAAAKRELARQFPKAPDKQREQLERQKQFRAYVTSMNRTVTSFANEGQLVTRACLVYRDWDNELLRASRREEPEPSIFRQPSDQELGRLGRERQLAEFRDLVAARELAQHGAMAVLLQGDEEMGQAKFARALIADELRDYREVWGCPTGKSFDADGLAHWLLRDLTRTAPEKGKGLAVLSDTLRRHLDQRSVAVVLTRAAGFRGGLDAFRTDFWQPLAAALSVPSRRAAHALVFLLLDDEDSHGAKGAACSLPADCSIGRITLTRFTPVQVMQWLSRHGISDDPKRSRKDIVDDVLSKKNGEPSPETVFRRLALTDLWCEGSGSEDAGLDVYRR